MQKNQDTRLEVLRNGHHVWYQEATFATHGNPFVRNFRMLACSVVDIYAAAHSAIHGNCGQPGCAAGLYRTPVMPKISTMRQTALAHDSGRHCLHPRNTTLVSVFDLSSEPWQLQSFPELCGWFEIDMTMLTLVRKAYNRNSLASAQAHFDRLMRLHTSRVCTCYFHPDVRHIPHTVPSLVAA